MSTSAVKLQVVQILETEPEVKAALLKITELMQSHLETYQWVGFYFMNHNQQTLHLGPFSGKPTEHTVIPFGKGICGQVAESGQTYTVDDVNAQDNYIACSLDVKAEIVVPLYVGEKLVGQIDIDSHHLNAFTGEDELFLKDLNALLAAQYGTALIALADEVSAGR